VAARSSTSPEGKCCSRIATAGSAADVNASGSWLALIHALLEAAVTGNTRSSVALIFSARSDADVVDRDRFLAWESHHASFRFIRTLTSGAGRPPRGRISALLPQLYVRPLRHDVFIVGAPSFVVACAAAAVALGARREHIHTDVFFVEPEPSTRRISREAASR
jgi:ferredoxin-NADP reductase